MLCALYCRIVIDGLGMTPEDLGYDNPFLSASVGSLSNYVFEPRTSTGSGLCSFFDGGFAQIFSQIASITVKKLRNTNFISSRHVKGENTSLPVDVRRSKTSLLKLPAMQLGAVINSPIQRVSSLRISLTIASDVSSLTCETSLEAVFGG